MITTYTTSALGNQCIQHYESIHDGDLSKIGYQPKMCPAGIWTVGWGHAVIDPKTNKFLKGEQNKARALELYPNLTKAQAIELLKADLKSVERMVNSLRLDITQTQFDALVSFAYNLGFSRLEGSSLLRRIKDKASHEEITKCFGMWNKANGKILPGLTYRRQTEALLFTTGKLQFFN